MCRDLGWWAGNFTVQFFCWTFYFYLKLQIAKQLKSNKHDSVYMSEKTIHVTVTSISYLFMLFLMRGFQYLMSLEGIRGKKIYNREASLVFMI